MLELLGAFQDIIFLHGHREWIKTKKFNVVGFFLKVLTTLTRYLPIKFVSGDDLFTTQVKKLGLH